MKEELRRITSAATSPVSAVNMVREYLQARILGLMQDTGCTMHLAFCGVTALRFLFGLNRFSEDLDFSLVENAVDFSMDYHVERLVQSLRREGYRINQKWTGSGKTVRGVMLRFIGLPFELGLSPRENQNFSIRIEADLNPPAGTEYAISIVRRFQLLRLHHLDKSSLFAGKIHAVLARPHAKGRDFYDLAWYLGSRDWPDPNMIMLRNSLIQTGWKSTEAESICLHDVLTERFLKVDWSSVRRDIEPFIEDRNELSILNLQDMDLLLGKLSHM